MTISVGKLPISKKEVEILSLAALTFLSLKLMGGMSWSYWVVLAPVWAPFAVYLSVVSFTALCYFMLRVLEWYFKKTGEQSTAVLSRLKRVIYIKKI